MTRIFVAGGAGYVGSKLVPLLLERGYDVTVYDLYLYGEEVFSPWKQYPGLREVRADIRDLEAAGNALKGCDHVIHLACISNDPSFELNPELGKSINYDAFEPFVRKARETGIRRFLYASSSSVYGIKEEPNVTEDMILEPLTDYSKYKAACEEVLLRYNQGGFIPVVLRPATVCGYAPRQRLDVVVNILTNLAYHTGKIVVMGGGQKRPNIHIDDMAAAYLHLLEADEDKIRGEIFNVGCQNLTVDEIGSVVARLAGNCNLEKKPTNDPRSYHISSEKIVSQLGFRPLCSVENAVQTLLDAFRSGKLPRAMEDKRYYNIKTMKEINLV